MCRVDAVCQTGTPRDFLKIISLPRRPIRPLSPVGRRLLHAAALLWAQHLLVNMCVLYALFIW